MTNRALTVLRPGRVELSEQHARDPGADEALVVPDLVGLCGTDLEIIDGRLDPAYVRYPLVIGHEWTGTLTDAAPGPAGTLTPAGTRVVVEGIVPCGHCPSCRQGLTNLCDTYDEIGFIRDGAAAATITVPVELIHPVAPHVLAEDAVLVEPAAVVYRGLRRAQPHPGQRVLVIGDGTIGLLAAQLVRLWSPATVNMLGARPAQSALARTVGVDEFTTGTGTGEYDLVIEAAGQPQALQAAWAAPRRGGTVLCLGLSGVGAVTTVSGDDLVNNDLRVLGSFSYTSSAWRETVELLNAGRWHAGGLITHRFPLSQWQQAIDALRHSPGPRGKVVLEI